ncbi:MAG: HD-GYP domain-containing protein [Eubacterium sp.]|nr:HD-GYP domain-containing protein [Eubacterium sp.]
METFSEIVFFIGQLVILPPYLAATSNLRGRKLSTGQVIKYILISPPFVYIYTIFLFGLIAALKRAGVLSALNEESLQNAVAWGDLLALFLSYLLALFYSKGAKGKDKLLFFFVYLCFYISRMVFDITFSELPEILFFGLAVPCIFSYAMYRFLAKPLTELAKMAKYLNAHIIVFALLLQGLLILRFHFNLFFMRYDFISNIMMKKLWNVELWFGYLIHILLLVGCVMLKQYMSSIREVAEKNDQLAQNNQKITRISIDALKTLAATVDAKDSYTNGHSMRVSRYAEKIARKMGYDQTAADTIGKAAMMHDIGKIGIPDAILKKPAVLTKEEYDRIKTHSEKGYEILQNMEYMPELALGARYHHERWDGGGYPEGISGEDIPAVARITAAADAYDAMTSNRAYSAMSVSYARSEIEKNSGTQFDPRVADALLELIDGNEIHGVYGVSDSGNESGNDAGIHRRNR